MSVMISVAEEMAADMLLSAIRGAQAVIICIDEWDPVSMKQGISLHVGIWMTPRCRYCTTGQTRDAIAKHQR
jgi:hypothetical protein